MSSLLLLLGKGKEKKKKEEAYQIMGLLGQKTPQTWLDQCHVFQT